MKKEAHSRRQVRVALFGHGSVGSAAAELCATRPWIDVVGAIVRDPEHARTAEIPIVSTAEVDEFLDEGSPDVALVATHSAISDVLPDIERCARRGIHVISTAEELAFPAVTSKEASAKLTRLAKESGVVIAATGINPGFVYDALPLAVAGAAWDISRLYISRSLDASVFGRGVHQSLGVGYDPDAFVEAQQSGIIHGHIGFEESANIISRAMGLRVEKFEEKVEPLFADRQIPLRDYEIDKGQTAGVRQHAAAWIADRRWLEFDLALHVTPDLIGMGTKDRILIEGANRIDVTIEPGTQAILTTSARLVNTIPGVLTSEPGLYNAADLLPAAPWFGKRHP